MTDPSQLASEAHIWLTAPAATEAIPDYLRLLAPEELEQYHRYKVERARRLYLAARALARSVLSHYAPETRPGAWRFEFNKHGRPEICGPTGHPPLRFNLSHTDGLVACLVTLELDAGVDVERIDRRVNLLGIAESKFSALEAGEIVRLGAQARRERFFRYWTLKEAYIKARGMGLALPLRKFSYAFERSGEVSVHFDPDLGDRASDWQLALWRSSPEHYLAVALKRGSTADRRLVIRRSTPLLDQVETTELAPIARSAPAIAKQDSPT